MRMNRPPPGIRHGRRCSPIEGEPQVSHPGRTLRMAPLVSASRSEGTPGSWRVRSVYPGSVPQWVRCIAVQSTAAWQTRGAEPWHGPPRGEADAHTRTPCHATMRARAPAKACVRATFYDASLGIGDHGPQQRRHGCGPETGLDGHEEQDVRPCRRAGGGERAQHDPLLERADPRGVLAWHRGTPVAAVCQLIEEELSSVRML
jgi:hypothetical protein